MQGLLKLLLGFVCQIWTYLEQILGLGLKYCLNHTIWLCFFFFFLIAAWVINPSLTVWFTGSPFPVSSLWCSLLTSLQFRQFSASSGTEPLCIPPALLHAPRAAVILTEPVGSFADIFLSQAFLCQSPLAAAGELRLCLICPDSGVCLSIITPLLQEEGWRSRVTV